MNTMKAYVKVNSYYMLFYRRLKSISDSKI